MEIAVGKAIKGSVDIFSLFINVYIIHIKSINEGV